MTDPTGILAMTDPTEGMWLPLQVIAVTYAINTQKSRNLSLITSFIECTHIYYVIFNMSFSLVEEIF